MPDVLAARTALLRYPTAARTSATMSSAQPIPLKTLNDFDMRDALRSPFSIEFRTYALRSTPFSERRCLRRAESRSYLLARLDSVRSGSDCLLAARMMVRPSTPESRQLPPRTTVATGDRTAPTKTAHRSTKPTRGMRSRHVISPQGTHTGCRDRLTVGNGTFRVVLQLLRAPVVQRGRAKRPSCRQRRRPCPPATAATTHSDRGDRDARGERSGHPRSRCAVAAR